MKYIIDIPEEFYITARSNGKTYIQNLIRNGVPLDSLIEKIETEIEEERKDENIPYDLYPYSYKEGLDKAMSIINKHVKENEGK